jgi:hypothetical protein
MTARSQRRGAVDLARVGALALVVLGHLSMAVIDRGPDGALRGDNVLSLHPSAAWLAMLAPMPVFFAAGGWANAASTAVAAAARVRRVVGLAAVVVGVWWAAAVVEWLVHGGRGIVNDGARLATQPFWFLAAYVPFAVAGATMARWVQRPFLAVGACLAGLVMLDVARFALGAPEWVGWPGFLLAWAVPWLLGAAWRADQVKEDADARSERRHGAALAVAAGLGAAALVWLAGYQPALIDAVEGERSNTTPPTLFTAVAGMVQVGLLMVAAAPLDRLAARWRRHLDRGGELSVAVYSWHLTALVLCVVPLAAGLWAPERFGLAWWLTRPVWFAAVLGVTLLLVAATERVAQHLPRRPRGEPATTLVWAGVVMAAVGAGAAGRWGPRTPTAALVSLAGLCLGWWWLGGAWRAHLRRPMSIVS